ncbi:MAG: NUDIX domain-containing protein [Rhodospirillaceae bacterium]|jgi:8-oxo-dGTP pyrophosphatase MutT (NUDIX family)|nr:NUDIX domain-containing protein [Rhodospirillaceae bacterium]MBT6119211.1 NUDIX domain-containing protein [Rhodospirillaceae bacterium]
MTRADSAARDRDDPREGYDWSPRSPVRARDAASLVLIREGDRGPEVLMGQRSKNLDFMPHRYVFPGGRLDTEDHRVRPATDFRPSVKDKLARSLPPDRARALAVAAIRETFEETGLILGKPAPAPKGSVTEDWKGFLDLGLAPALDELDAIGRAITPAQLPKRFNARFFVARADHVQGEIVGSGELINIGWLPVEEAIAMGIADITEIVARLALRWFQHPQTRFTRDPLPLYCFRRGRRMVIER